MELSEAEIFGDFFNEKLKLETAIARSFEDVQRLLAFNPMLATSAVAMSIEKGQLQIAERILLSYNKVVTAIAAQAAVCTGSTEAVSLLLDHGWDVNAPCGSGQPMLSYAVHDVHMVKHLLARGADPNFAHLIDTTPLSIAVGAGNTAVVKAMAESGGDFARGQLMHHAVHSKCCEIGMLGLLVENNASLDEIEFEGHTASLRFRADFPRGTPLHVASAKGNLCAVSFLVEKGADLKKLDTRGRCPSELAYEQGQHHICNFSTSQTEGVERNNKL